MRQISALILMWLAISSIACQTPRAGAPLAQGVRGDDAVARLKFQRQIVDRRICSNDDAFHLLIQYANGQDPCGAYAERVSWLKSRQMLPDGFDRPADEAI